MKRMKEVNGVYEVEYDLVSYAEAPSAPAAGVIHLEARARRGSLLGWSCRWPHWNEARPRQIRG